MKLIGIQGPRPCFCCDLFDRRCIENSQTRLILAPCAPEVDRLGPALLQRRVIQKRVGLGVEDLVRQGRRFWKVAADALTEPSSIRLRTFTKPPRSITSCKQSSIVWPTSG